ncbi:MULTISPECIES: helix-turn-helix domain-containing protein [Bacillus]|uniref:helix-turn-helix domain-containing protein n=1 Tax=Bacillus TaxID=1386 RepID=UPI0001A18F07|nr:helix-turn-helix transcriptional regulator [Bacillus pseudomycoides]EEM13310.1 PXO1 ORF14-like protein [Bacillus pseudomycoides DSM 12442]MED1599414.1 helix-turn-helix transcriptional regulator [Bacillus pseudomycoides]MED4714423.1 helix-turn-helix transcriptional regulator [Bacillus pseudomycoides]OOR49096.1 XRE family transcriptional regulator [Bacillus pseudomycoides]PDX98387.1 XRE family transcriptional regulator [Bacillus pseudomycoides]
MEDVLQLFRDALSITEPLYKQNEQLWHKWNSYYVDVEADNSKIVTSEYLSPSFSMLVQWVKQQQGKGISALDIFKNIDAYKVKIHETIDVFIAQEFRNEETVNTITHTPVIEPTANIAHENYLEVNNSAVYYKLRDGIAKNQFEEDENTKLKSYPIEAKDSNGVAQLSSHKDEDLRLTNIEEAARWNTLVDGVMSNMDDLTADVLDTITIQWLNEANSPDEFIDFSYEQVLEMCSISKAKANGVEYYRVEDKIKVAKRIAALASIFIYLNDENEVVVLNDRAETGKHYEVKREVIKRLFVLDSVVLWRDKNTNEYMGIESCRIKPGSFLSSYLYGSNSTTALLSKKALEYNSYRHKYHKRLIRYLTWQWRIRQMFSNLKRPYSIGGDKGLLAVMGINQKQKPNRIRDQLENVLSDLEKEGVISHWGYDKELDEDQLTKKNWFKKYYSQLGIVILPPNELIRSMENLAKKKDTDVIHSTESLVKKQTIDVIHRDNQPVKTEERPLDINRNEQLIRDKIEFMHRRKNITMRELSAEIGISQPTLSRFYNKKTKRLSGTARDKLNQWYKRQMIIDKM